jgi:hypothetical protein
VAGLTVILVFIAMILWLIHPAMFLIAAAVVTLLLVAKALNRRLTRDVKKSEGVTPPPSSTISPPTIVTLIRTAEVDRLIREKSSLWEYKLTAELLVTNIQPIRALFDALKGATLPVLRRSITEQEFLRLIREKVLETQALGNRLVPLFNEELMRAWGPSGVPGDATAIQQAVAEIVGTSLQLYECERAMGSVIPPAQYARLHQGLCGIAEHIFGSVEAATEQIRSLLSDPNVNGRHVIALTIDLAPNFPAVQQELNQILATKKALLASLDAAQRAQRAAADGATAGLLAGLLGAWAGWHLFNPKPHNPPSIDDRPWFS